MVALQTFRHLKAFRTTNDEDSSTIPMGSLFQGRQLCVAAGESGVLMPFMFLNEDKNLEFSDPLNESPGIIETSNNTPLTPFVRICRHKFCPYTEPLTVSKLWNHLESWHSRDRMETQCPLTVRLTFRQLVGRVSAMAVMDNQNRNLQALDRSQEKLSFYLKDADGSQPLFL